jgi:hypothetical protein
LHPVAVAIEQCSPLKAGIFFTHLEDMSMRNNMHFQIYKFVVLFLQWCDSALFIRLS